MVYGDSKEEVHRDLLEAVRAGLVLHSESSYRFLHDRVQEAAYSLIPESRAPRLISESAGCSQPHSANEKRKETIFEIVNQLNRGSHLITSDEERERVAELNLIAGRRAKISTAYASALKYLAAGAALLTEETAGSDSYELIFALECLTGRVRVPDRE